MLQLLKVSISKRAQLTVDLPENLPAVRANAAQIRQVVMNLITNAAGARNSQGGAWGSPPCMESSGHGGTTNVVSTRSGGSRVEVLLPCYGQAVRGATDTLQPASAGQGGIACGTILIVEDEEELRRAVSKMLRKLKFSVIEAGDGPTGVDLFRTNQKEIDVVLLDLTLPGMTGGEVLREVRRMRTSVEVVITTAYSKDSAMTAIDKQQPWLFIRKPYRLSELVDLLGTACLRAQSSGQTGG
jgi:CheY-like chemotaxis protein